MDLGKLKDEIIETSVMTESTVDDKKEHLTSEINATLPKKSIVRSVLHKIIFTIVAVVLFVTAWTICDKIKEYGLDIALIRSVGGKTLEEAYYADIGKIYIYLADFIKVLTAGISGIILCITYK